MEFFSTRDIARLLRISQRRAYELMVSRVVPSVRLGKRIVAPKPAFDAWCKAQVSEALASCEACGGKRGKRRGG